MLTKEDRKDIYKIFCEAAEEVIMPAVEIIVKREVKSEVRKEIKKGVREEIKKGVREEFDRYERRELVRQDKMMKELKNVREEQVAAGFMFEKIDENYIDHEKRIGILEEKAA